MDGCIYTEYDNGFLTCDYYLSENMKNIRLVSFSNNICNYSNFINSNKGLHTITIPWNYNLDNTYLCSGNWLEHDFKLISCIPLVYYNNIPRNYRNMLCSSRHNVLSTCNIGEATYMGGKLW